MLALFLGLAQLSIACSTEKRSVRGESLGMRLQCIIQWIISKKVSHWWVAGRHGCSTMRKLCLIFIPLNSNTIFIIVA